MSFAYVLLALNLLGVRQLPPGTQLHVRLLNPIGSYASRAGDPIRAVLIAPVCLDPGLPDMSPDNTVDEIILPAGSILSGHVKSVQRVGLGIMHENAALTLDFNTVTTPTGESVPLHSLVRGVDSGRERVARDGSIRAMRATNTLSYRFSGYVRTALQWEFHAALAVWVIKTLAVQVPESELYYPAGVELTLGLTAPVTLRAPPPANTLDEGMFARRMTPRKLNDDDRGRMEELAATLPIRTQTEVTKRPSDLINFMFIGSREELTTAFTTAEWSQPEPSTLRTNVRRIRAVAEGRGDIYAPISILTVDNDPPDMSWQKSFNDVSKRDHIRIWRQPAPLDGRDVWIGAATRDIDFAYMRPGWAVTHKIEENIDLERDKVVNDLSFTTCVSLADEVKRPGFPSVAYNATGDPMKTDTHLAVIGFSRCSQPSEAPQDDGSRPSSAAGDDSPLPRHGNVVQRFARREILCFRSDVIRENIYWRGYEAIRYLVTTIRSHRKNRPAPDGGPGLADQTGQAPSRLEQAANRSQSLIDMLR